MRVLVVDQDSASNEAIARSLRDLYTVDAVTNKGDCLDLLRSNTFEVIVATERLEDGSGLELLGTVSRKWPSVLRIFAADRQRLQLLKGRLGPFELFQALTYPIDPDRLIATLNLAAAAQEAHADTSNIQHVVLSGEALPEPSEELEQAAEGQSGEFPAPQPMPRAASMDRSQAAPRVTRSAVRGGPSHRVRSIPTQRPRSNGAAAPHPTRMATGPSVARSAAPPPSLTSEGSRPLRHGRSRSATNRAPPVRFPPLERTPPLEPPQQSSARRAGASQTDSFAETAAMARAARSNFESPPEEFDTKRLAIMVGGGAAVVLAVVLLGFKLFGSKSEALRPAAPPVVHAPEYSQEVVDLVAQTESALKADDFKAARADIDQLRQLAPSHPRLAFFDGLLAQRSDPSKGSGSAAAGGHGAPKRGGQSSRRGGSNPAADESANVTAATAGSPSKPPASSASSTPSKLTSDASAAAPSIAPSRPASHTDSTSTGSPRSASGTGSGSRTATADESSGLPPETPPGLTRSSPVPPPAAGSTPATASVATAESAPTTASTPATPSADAASPASTHVASTSATRRASSGEPPPVIQEARLIRRVPPDYPSAAKRDGTAGSVDLEVTISSQGVVEDVSVVNATPPDMFEKSALAAVRKWKYDPRFVDGLPSEAHVKVHLDFGPGK
jgi:protein TonB